MSGVTDAAACPPPGKEVSHAAAFPAPLRILGVNLTPLRSYDHAIECVAHAVSTGEKLFCIAINPEKVQRAAADPALLALLGRIELGICDGVGAAWAARVLHGRRVARVTGCDLFERLCLAAPGHGWRVFFLGATEESNAGAARNLTQRIPGLRIVGRQDGFFQDSDEIVARINASGADLLFVAMGSPRQEFWIRDNRARLNPAFCMGVGGTFDVFSGTARRAPRMFRATGTEFLYRLLSDPKRWRRQLALPLFARRVLAARLRGTNG